MRTETLLIIQQGEEIILGLKNPNKKFGGKWNGFGGGIEEGETPEETIIREVLEEARIKIESPEKIGEILFHFETDEQDHYVHIYKTNKFEGELQTSEDFVEYQRFSLDNLPEKMMPADKYWIPLLIKGKRFKGEVYFDKTFTNPKVKINEVTEI